MRRTVPIVACALGLAAALPWSIATAGPHEPTIRSQPIDSLDALEGFHEALRELQQGERPRVRVLHWGDSNVAAGVWTRVTRDALQRRFGDGGPGYVLPRFGTHDHDDLMRSGSAWKARRRGQNGRYGPHDGRWGLGGVAAEGRGRKAWVEVQTQGDGGGVLEVHALGRPRGGKLRVEIDGDPVAMLSTSARSYGLVRRRYTLEPGQRRVRIASQGWHPVRLLGLVVERSEPGVVYDTLGVNGHRASAILEWDSDLIEAQLRYRKPDLIVLSYGGNEALDPNISPSRFATQLDEVLDRVGELVPDASVLVVGPVAMCNRRAPVSQLEPRLDEMIDVQRTVAERHDAAFWDASGVMGGPYALCGWHRHDPPLVSGDNLHLSREGYQVVGEKFTEALVPF